METRKYINSKRVAKYLGISVTTLHGMLQNNELPEYGKAVKMPGSGKYKYVFHTEKFKDLFNEELYPL